MTNYTPQTAMARTIILEARADAVVALCGAIVKLDNLMGDNSAPAKDAIMEVIGVIVSTLENEADKVARF